MRVLSNDLKILKKNYGEIFKFSYAGIEAAIDDLSNSERKSYLLNRLNKVKNEAIDYVKKQRDVSHCSGCGVCCRFAVSEFSPEELVEKSKCGDNFATQFISTFVPYHSEDEYSNIFPEYIELLKDEKYYVYHCPKVTDDNKCPDYENRPQICRDFPDNPIAFLPPNCGFMDWKLKSEPVWLKLRAEVEIINYYLEKLN